MNTTMFQLRSFIHQRLYAAAEDILGEVERTITLAVYDAKVGRPELENESLRHHLHKETGLSKASDFEDQCGTSLLQGDPGSPMTEDSNLSPSTEVPGPSYSTADLDNIDWSSCLAQAEFKVPAIKEEQEDIEDDREKQEAIFPSLAVVKSEQEEPEIHVPYEGQPVSSHCSAGQSENNDAEENRVNSSETVQSQSVSVNRTDQGELCENSPAKSQKDRSFCYLCGKGFQYIGSLMKHIKTHETKTECFICRKTYRYTKQLITHLRVHHDKTDICEICGSTFANNRLLELHRKTHTSQNEFVCQECGKIFYRKEHLVVHVRIHSGEKPYHCDVCGKSFSQSQNLTIHKRSHSGERPYHCKICGKLFNTSSHLKSHMRYHTGEKPYPCDICGKRFTQSGQMSRHRITHTGERPYACHTCGMRYRFAPNLKVHIKTHETSLSK